MRQAMRRERELTERLLSAYRNYTNEHAKKDATVAAADARIAACTQRLADALIAYTEGAGVRPDRAAVVLGVPRSRVTSMMRERRAALRRALV
jgi:predicted XRE-type DNA-binding protein